ncbi:hypothetical protein ACQKP5_15530 [Pseudomonas vancouverensis]|uniref:hypothetical protein n=1 Tax=Pseudomonas vancouverensis TaxID=95300 RepID=UPI003CFE25FF
MPTITLRNMMFIVFCFLLFTSYNSGLIAPNILGYSDELMLALGIIVLLAPPLVKLKLDRTSTLLIIYITYTVLNAAISRFSPNYFYALAQSLIHLKLFIVAQAVLVLYQGSRPQLKLIKNLFIIFVVLFIAGMLINTIAGEYWNSLISNDDMQYRYGFLRPVGYFGHYAPNSYFFSLALITITMLYSKEINVDRSSQIRKFFIFVVIDFLAAFPLTVRKGLFMIVPYGVYVLSLLKLSNRIAFTAAASLFLVVFAITIANTEMMADTINNFDNFFSDDHSYIRGLIVYYGYHLFLDFFPFGVGNGLYGTVFSNMNLSVYEYVGLNPYRLMKDDGTLSGVYDSGVSALMAESGFIGMVLVIAIIINFFKYNKNKLDVHGYRIFKVITSFAILLSLTEPVWQNGFFTTFYVSCLLYIYSKNNKFRINGKWQHHPGIRQQNLNTQPS